MADGNAVAGGSGYSRWNWHSYMNVYEVARTKTTVTYRVDLGYSSYYSINVYANGRIDGGNSWSGSISAGGNGWWQSANVATSDFTVPRSGGAYTKTFSGYVQATGGFGNGTSWVSVSVTVPQREYERPKPPRDFALERVSDTSQKLTWVGDYTDMNGDFPWSTIRVNRATDGGQRVNIQILGWDALNYTDNSTSAGHRYEYDVESTNPAGTSEKAGPLSVYTAPVAPSRVSASKTGLSSVELTASGHSMWWDSMRVEVTADGGKTWAAAESSVKSGSGSDDVVLSVLTVPAGTVRYRVRLSVGGLTSEWAESQQIVTITPPLAPTISKMAAAYPVGSTVRVSWVPNHPDGSTQSAAQVEFDGPSPSIVDVGTESSASVEVSERGAWRVRVRTKGLHDDWGAWSSWVPFDVALMPTAFFTNPPSDGSVVDSMPAVFSWEIHDDTGVSSQVLTISDSKSIQSIPVSRVARSVEVSGLLNKSTYTVILHVLAGSGLSVTATREFVTEWRPPAEPIVSVTVLDGLGCSVMLIAGEEEGAPETVSMDISRVLPDGSVLPLGSGLTSGQSVIDRLPPLNVEFAYRATATAESGSTSVNDYRYTLDSGGMEAFNFGPDGSVGIGLGLNASCSTGVEHDGEWFEFALGDDTPFLPSFYADGTMSATGRHSYVLTDVSKYRLIDSIRRDRRNAVCWYRDHWGGRHRVKADFDIGYSAGSYGIWDLSVSITETMWEEPISG